VVDGSQDRGKDSFRIATGSLLSVEQLSIADVSAILAITSRLESMVATERSRVLAGRTAALLFYESSTRTRTSFELAAKSLLYRER
jgi:aspartate carbamoyltransferase catalytic subunit